MMASSALLLLDLQNDFLHSNGAYGRAGLSSPDIAALPARLKPLTDLLRKEGGLIGATLFTLVPGKGGEPMISHIWGHCGRSWPRVISRRAAGVRR
jgi:nicotinamidase-related amidase